MEEIKYGDNLIIIKPYNGSVESVACDNLYFSHHLLDNNLKPDQTISHSWVTQLSLQNSDKQIIKSLYFIGILRSAGIDYNPLQYLLKENILILYFETTILALKPQTLDPIWELTDFFDVISIEEHKGDLFIHDELELVRIDKEGTVKWRFSGSDHFVSYDGTENFMFKDDFIRMVDSNEIEYHISYEGKDIMNINSNYFNGFSKSKDNLLQRIIKKFR